MRLNLYMMAGLGCALIIFTCAVIPGVSAESGINGFGLLSPGSDDENGVLRSLSIPVDTQDIKPIDSIRKISVDAGDNSRYPEAHTITLVSIDRTAFDQEGYYHLFQQDVVKILTEEGRESHSSISIGYSIPYSRVRIIEAFVVSPQGELVLLGGESITDVSDSSDSEANIYEPIWRNKVIAFPEVQIGSIIGYTAEHVAVKPMTPGVLDWGHTFRSFTPMYYASCCLTGPGGVIPYWYVANDPDHQVRSSRTETENSWTICWESHDLPMLIAEPSMIPDDELKTVMLFSTRTWKEYSRSESVMIEPNLIPDEAIRLKVDELTRDAKSSEEKLGILFRYVTRKVRYMGVSFGERPGVNPDPVSRTFQNNAGVCKDKAGLLTSMLRLVGIEAYYTLNNPEHRIFTEVATDQFNHAIVTAHVAGENEYRYLDVTTDLERSMIPAYSGGTAVLRITPEGDDIDIIPITAPTSHLGTLTAESRIDEDGTLFSSVHYTGSGDSDSAMRAPFYYIAPSQHREWFLYLLEELSPSVELDEFRVRPEPLDDLTQPFEFDIKFHIPKYMTRANSFGLMKMPMSLGIFDTKYHYISEAASLKERKYPLDLISNFCLQVQETMSFPESIKIKAIPDPVHLKGGGLQFDRVFSAKGSTIQLDQNFTVYQPRVKPDEYNCLLTTLNQISTSKKAFVIFDVPERGVK